MISITSMTSTAAAADTSYLFFIGAPGPLTRLPDDDADSGGGGVRGPDGDTETETDIPLPFTKDIVELMINSLWNI